MTTIYLVRHSIPFKEHKGKEETNESLLFQNIKSPLSIEGEKLAEKLSLLDEFKSLDTIWSSNYVRAMSTAKYFAFQNNLKVNISDKLGERKHGINSWDELPKDFEQKQFLNPEYKVGFGENQLEVRKRMEEIFFRILNENQNKRVAIITHATIVSFLLKKWCETTYKGPYKFKDKIFFDGIWNYCETFKLTFNEQNNLVNIENLKFDI